MTLAWALQDGELVDLTLQDQWWVDQAWDEWRKYLCVEANGGHSWLAELESIEDGGGINLDCEHCPATVHDLYPDGCDLVYGEVDGIPVDAGRHRSLDYYTAPVTVAVHVEHYPSNPAHGEEWDVWVEVESRSAFGYLREDAERAA
jgi:hypothetical protein